MKKLFHFYRLILQVAIVTLASIQIASGQTSKHTSQIPEEINKVFRASCYACHGPNGKFLPMEKLNFSKWADYGAKKEADKATKICSVLTEGSMPPKSFRESHPDAIPAKEQIALICKWAESLKPAVGGK